ncbi:hypothetical protein PCI56_02940 [Plesiomonas shigelloides subsp. oncorhynchi]|nr:hypothetical protein [Plesiomonas shigelloides]
MAAQKPVASTDFPALDGYRELVHVGTDADRFTLAIQQAALDAPIRRPFATGWRKARLIGRPYWH